MSTAAVVVDKATNPASSTSDGIENKIYDLIIVGGGLSGLLIASRISQSKDKTFLLLEANNILGGRLRNDGFGDDIDMGGAWIWPRSNPLMSTLIKEEHLQVMNQPGDKSCVRICGGVVMLIHKLAEKIQANNIRLNVAVQSLMMMDSGDYIEIKSADGFVVKAKQVVITGPPKVISQNILFSPPLCSRKQIAMAASQTWMAGVTKVSLVYEIDGLSRDFTIGNMGLRNYDSESGCPAFQVYDACTENENIFALTFFVLATGTDDDKSLATQCGTQLREVVRGGTSIDFTNFSRFHVQRWPHEKYISEDREPSDINPHPDPTKALAESDWDGSLVFAGTESDIRFPGMMEGAVGSAFRAVSFICNQ